MKIISKVNYCMSLLKPKCHENSKEKLNYDKIKTFMKNISQNYYKYKKIVIYICICSCFMLSVKFIIMSYKLVVISNCGDKNRNPSLMIYSLVRTIVLSSL